MSAWLLNSESTTDQVAHDIGRIINISDCTIDKDKQRLLSGRKRYGVSVAANIASVKHNITSTEAKQHALNITVDKSILLAQRQLVQQIRYLLKNDKAGGVWVGDSVCAFALHARVPCKCTHSAD